MAQSKKKRTSGMFDFQNMQSKFQEESIEISCLRQEISMPFASFKDPLKETIKISLHVLFNESKMTFLKLGSEWMESVYKQKNMCLFWPWTYPYLTKFWAHRKFHINVGGESCWNQRFFHDFSIEFAPQFLVVALSFTAYHLNHQWSKVSGRFVVKVSLVGRSEKRECGCEYCGKGAKSCYSFRWNEAQQGRCSCTRWKADWRGQLFITIQMICKLEGWCVRVIFQHLKNGKKFARKRAKFWCQLKTVLTFLLSTLYIMMITWISFSSIYNQWSI